MVLFIFANSPPAVKQKVALAQSEFYTLLF